MSRKLGPIHLKTISWTSLLGLIFFVLWWLSQGEAFAPTLTLTPEFDLVIEIPSPVPSPAEKPPASSGASLVTRIIDGDTIELATGEKVRYIGIDTPEKNQNECFHREATSKNAELVLNQWVTLEVDVRNQDRYGRLLRYVWVNEQLVNEILVREGYALAASYPPDIKYQARLQSAQQQAQENEVGLWRSCRFFPESVE